MKENYSDWEFLLDGNPHELRGLSEGLGTGYLNIYGGIDDWNDCFNNDFRMTTMYAQDEVDAETVWQVGYELLSLYNGASELFQLNARKLSIHELRHKGVAVKYVAPRNFSALLKSPPNFSQARIAEEYKHARKHSIKLVLVHLATENKDVFFILKYLDMAPGWVTYYKLMEAVESFAKAKSIQLGADAQDRNAFTNTANNFSLSGFEARHGFKEMVKSNKTRSMNLEEAHAFVTSMVKSYLNQAYGSTSKT